MATSTPDLVVRLAQAVREAGGRALLVGGCVRDALDGRTPKDVDVEVYGMSPPRLRTLLADLGRVDAVGESFTVYKVGGLDVSIPRRESKTGRGHKGFTVEGDPALSFEEAARRRDFTINAISRDPLTDEIVDPFHGREDLAARRLRVVDPQTFVDDSLRVLRAVQFAARFEMSVDPETRALLAGIPLDDLPAERVWGEVEKLVLLAERPSIGFALALDIRVIARVFPEMGALVGCPQDAEWHPEGDVWTHTLMVIDEAHARIAGLERGPATAVMLGAICHDLGKPATTAVIDGRIRSPGHEEAGVGPATALLDRLNVHSLDGYDVRGQVLGLVTEHMRPGAFHKTPMDVTDGAFRRLALKVNLELLARFAEADCRGRSGPFDCSAMTWFLERARDLGVSRAAATPIVLGRHLMAIGMAPGPNMGRVLREIYEKQLDGDVTTVEEGLTLARGSYLFSTDPAR
jgi:tRNA nucleotidyltransferase (CCA-adding enzyme)